jgi:hypothetical protein
VAATALSQTDTGAPSLNYTCLIQATTIPFHTLHSLTIRDYLCGDSDNLPSYKRLGVSDARVVDRVGGSLRPGTWQQTVVSAPGNNSLAASIPVYHTVSSVYQNQTIGTGLRLQLLRILKDYYFAHKISALDHILSQFNPVLFTSYLYVVRFNVDILISTFRSPSGLPLRWKFAITTLHEFLEPRMCATCPVHLSLNFVAVLRRRVLITRLLSIQFSPLAIKSLSVYVMNYAKKSLGLGSRVWLHVASDEHCTFICAAAGFPHKSVRVSCYNPTRAIVINTVTPTRMGIGPLICAS